MSAMILRIGHSPRFDIVNGVSMVWAAGRHRLDFPWGNPKAYWGYWFYAGIVYPK